MDRGLRKRYRGRYVAHYQQIVQDIPVWKSNAFVLLGEDGRLNAFGSTFFPEGHDVTAVIGLTSNKYITSSNAGFHRLACAQA